MADESRLSITIDSRGAEKNADNLSDALDRVEESGNEASASTSRLSEVTLKLGSNMSKAAAATVASLSRIESATESTSTQLTALISRSVALENAMTAVGQGVGRLDSGITQSNAQLGQLNTQMAHLVTTFGAFSQGQSAINAQLTRIAANMSQAADEAQGLDQATSRVGRSSRSTEQSIDEERAGLVKLLGQINPTVAALDRLDAMQEKLARYKKLGLVDAETVAEANARLKAMRDALSDTSDGLNKTGQSAKQMANNLRMLPAQITDITVGLASGQAPFTVLLQQGGQLKDMFGGIGPAAKAVGGYVAGLVNPFTLAAAAVGALGVAYYQGSEETEAMTNAIIANGNAAGTSTSQLYGFAQQIAKGNATVGEAAEVLTQFAAAGNPLTTLYTSMGTSAINWSKVTGQSIDEVAQNFNDLAKNPVQAVKKLDDQLHFLTAAQYANIQSLQEQGRTMDAARVATEAYADALDGRSKEMERNLGYVETAWNSVAAAAKGAWDAMLNVGRPTSIDDQIAEIERKLAQPKFGLLTSDADFDRSKQLLREQLDFLKAKKEAQEYDAKYFAEQNKIQEAGKKFVDATNSAYNSTLPQVKKLQDLLDNLKKQHDENAKNGVVDAVTETKYATARKNIEQQIADIKEREAKKNAPKGQNKGVAEADNTASRLLAQYDPAAQAARTLTKEESQLQLALSKGKITREEYGKALAQASLNYAAAIKGAQGLTAAEQYQAQLERQLLIQREQYAAQAAAVGMGTQEAQRYQQRLQLEQQTNDRILQLRTELAQATTEKQRQELQAQIDLTNEYLPQQIAAMQQGWAQMDAAMANPINGWTAAVQNFGTQAANVAGQVQSTFETAFGTLTNGLTEKITSLDLSLKSLGEVGMDAIRGIISSFVKMGVQMGANALLAMTLGASQTTATVAMAGTTAAAWAPAAAMASLATLGGNSVPAATALTSTTALASTLAAIPGLATGGMVNGTGTGTSDSNLRWLSNGEFVVNAEATRRNRALLEAINSNDRTPVSAGRGASSSPAIAAAPTVNLYEDSSKAGSVNTRTADDGSQAIDIWVASIMGDGKAHKAMQQKYGLRTAGT